MVSSCHKFHSIHVKNVPIVFSDWILIRHLLKVQDGKKPFYCHIYDFNFLRYHYIHAKNVTKSFHRFGLQVHFSYILCKYEIKPLKTWKHKCETKKVSFHHKLSKNVVSKPNLWKVLLAFFACIKGNLWNLKAQFWHISFLVDYKWKHN